MPKKKYFLSQADLSKLLKNYGGGYHWKIHKQMSKSGNVTYMDTQGGMLSVNQLWDQETDKPYVMVYLSHSDGKIYRKDKWDWFDTVRQLYFDWTLQDGDYDLEFKELEGKAMAKKRQSHTQKLQAELENYKEYLARSEELVKRLRENGENSYMNSITFIQMQERIKFLEAAYKSSEIEHVNIQGRWKKFSDSERKLYEDNKAFLEHEGDSDYFIGIIDCYREINEVHKYKDEAKSLEGKIQGYKDLIENRDKEIERLQGIIAELKHEIPTTPILSPEMQYQYDEAIRNQETYQNALKRERDKSQKLEEQIESLKKAATATVPSYEVEQLKKQLEQAVQNANANNFRAEYECKERGRIESELNKRIEELEIQLSEKPTTDNIPDDELENLSRNDIRKKSSEAIKGKPDEDYKVTWYDYYNGMSRQELLKRISYVETISNRRADKIHELKKELQSKRYDQYSEEDSITYNAALQKISALEHNLELYQGFYENSEKRVEELQQKVTELASATLTPEESIKVIEQNIEQDKELKKANQKKQGRPVTVTDTQRAVIFELHKNGHSIRAIAKQVGKSVGTIHRILNEQ